ncbi:MAG: DUF928 domain-containing protein [Tychonema bourrellyi B0820]|uniref:DUF928 domain-containing protein n=1 Tax=Tychonema bourrellyi FEM_GT703 TaxID=2040638 RepID=A0A2G4F689_9CYAN|nr:DUF928 domain-containing protein [Tychonema bourrellyi]MDQ2098721.1 DUF928 domain-containing protein [Tychonema bourrellyi B0820]PHX57303.1 DUF928 domain-containing protein [Tychonema bourrellyi FEM_GT703]
MTSITKRIQLGLSLVILSLTSIYPELVAQSATGELFNNTSIGQNRTRKRVHFVTPTIKPSGSRRHGSTHSDYRTGGASRGDCPMVKKPLTALIPDTNIGLTISEHPTLWFYIPYTAVNNRSAELVLLDEKNKLVYSTALPLAKTSGITKVTIAKTLEIGKTYKWVFSVICNPANRTGDKFVKGEVRRELLSSAVQNQLKEVTEEHDRAIIYAENGLWFDALTSLAELRLKAPQDQNFIEEWADLLGEIGLADIASEDFVL